MTIFDVQTEKITAFDTRNTCLFKMYFDENQLFKQLKTYYNKNKYRFEIPESDLNQVRQFFDKYYSGLTVLDHVEDYCVVVKKRADSSNILRKSIMKKGRGQHETAIMTDKLSKEQAIEKGTSDLDESEVQKEELEW